MVNVITVAGGSRFTIIIIKVYKIIYLQVILLQKLDLNKDGVVTMDEFMEYCSKVRTAMPAALAFISHHFDCSMFLTPFFKFVVVFIVICY